MNPMQRKAILDSLAETVGAERAAAICKRADRYFGTVVEKATPEDYLNATLRESFRDAHDGDVSEWDKLAVDGGAKKIGRVKLGEEGALPGDRYSVGIGADKLFNLVAEVESGRHFWTIHASYVISDEEAAHANEGVDVMLNKEHLASLTVVVCFVCEQPHDLVASKPCLGEPVSYQEDGAPVYRDGESYS